MRKHAHCTGILQFLCVQLFSQIKFTIVNGFGCDYVKSFLMPNDSRTLIAFCILYHYLQSSETNQTRDEWKKMFGGENQQTLKNQMLISLLLIFNFTIIPIVIACIASSRNQMQINLLSQLIPVNVYWAQSFASLWINRSISFWEVILFFSKLRTKALTFDWLMFVKREQAEREEKIELLTQ